MADKILSVFIDESGDFGPYDAAAPYYLVAMILHNQDVNITENISLMDEHIDRLGYPNHAIHTGPLIRRESVYANELMEDRNVCSTPCFILPGDWNFTISVPKSEKSNVQTLLQ